MEWETDEKQEKGKEGQKVNSFWTSGLETNFAKDQLSKSSIAKKTSCLRKSSIVKKTRCLSVKSRFINLHHKENWEKNCESGPIDDY